MVQKTINVEHTRGGNLNPKLVVLRRLRCGTVNTKTLGSVVILRDTGTTLGLLWCISPVNFPFPRTEMYLSLRVGRDKGSTQDWSIE